eukprot:TRINITY_DN1007_c0_g1_i1.p1 TRINITY_DN1007_c0_g1~~TRINITY_DN1007_c0_g1_i1.p1  ORF type:complete len:131 (+),score=62.20 TRINITY_DN1007_c0_g1_i1:175-567(+)
MKECQRAPWGVPFFAFEEIVQIIIVCLEVSGLAYAFKDKRPNVEEGVCFFILALVYFFIVGWIIGLVLLAMGVILMFLLLIIDAILIILYLITCCYCCRWTPKMWWADFKSDADSDEEEGIAGEEGEADE